MSSVHPAIEGDIRVIDELIASGRGGLSRHLELIVALQAQRDFLVDRPQMVAFNTLDSVKHLMRVEGWEVVESVLEAFQKGQVVDGRSSSEGADWIIFASHYRALIERSGRRFEGIGRAEVVLGLEMLKVMTKIFPHFNPMGSLTEKVNINRLNWPKRPLQAPHEWSRAQMGKFHGEVIRPAIKILRTTMPGEMRVMHPNVAEAIERGDKIPPNIDGALSGYEQAYLSLIASIPDGIPLYYIDVVRDI